MQSVGIPENISEPPAVGGVLPSNLMKLRPEQELNALLPIDVAPSGIVTDVSEKQELNALLLIDVAPSGIVIDASEEHELSALMPIDVTPSGIVTDVSE